LERKDLEILHTLSWEVEPLGQGVEEAFIVDLGRLAFGESHGNPLVRLKRSSQVSGGRGEQFPSNRLLTLGLAPSIQEWSHACSMRTVRECLFTIKWLYRFVEDATKSLGLVKAPENFSSAEDYVLSLDRAIGVAFAGWLKSIPSADATRAGRYAVAKIFLENALGDLAWRSNPFEYNVALLDDEVGEAPTTPEQIGALVSRCKEILRKFKSDRTSLIHAARLDGPIKTQKRQMMAALPDLSESLVCGRKDLSEVLLPSVDIACACFLLAVIQLGCNEQPLRDIRANSPWWRRNPFSDDYRLICLEKNRAGGRTKRYKLAAPPGPKLIKITVKAAPQFQPFKVIRYYGLLSRPLRNSCREASVGEPNLKERDRAVSLSKSFWVFLGASGKAMSFNTYNLNGLMNSFIAKLAASMPILRNPDGSAIRYSAKDFRDAYFEFTMRNTAFDTVSGQAELSHSADSNSIRNYMNRVWAKKYARDKHRELQQGAFALLRQVDSELSPAALKSRIEGGAAARSNLAGVISVPPIYRPNQVRHGYFCQDPAQPPKEVYVPRSHDDVCPAEECWRCSHARCYDESLPELALDILLAKRERDECGAHAWTGSEAEARLESLEEVFARWPEAKRQAAMERATQMDMP
jgi:hypothetical protein